LSELNRSCAEHSVALPLGAHGRKICTPAALEAAPMSRLPTVREFTDRHVQTISPDLDIMDAVDFLLEKRVASGRFFSSGLLYRFLVDELAESDARAH
jgi:hypothetical protein